MDPNLLNEFPTFWAQNMGLFYVLSIWSLIWKGFAMWHSSQRKEKAWFIVFLIVNTFGLLEILYLFVFSRPKKEKLVKEEVKKKELEEKKEPEETTSSPKKED